uniref:Nucleolar protein 16 n=1 Tax=Apteryx owenii TaxID=8824 RepID=A0A8B9PR72_APTOW
VRTPTVQRQPAEEEGQRGGVSGAGPRADRQHAEQGFRGEVAPPSLLPALELHWLVGQRVQTRDTGSRRSPLANGVWAPEGPCPAPPVPLPAPQLPSPPSGLPSPPPPHRGAPGGSRGSCAGTCPRSPPRGTRASGSAPAAEEAPPPWPRPAREGDCPRPSPAAVARKRRALAAVNGKPAPGRLRARPSLPRGAPGTVVVVRVPRRRRAARGLRFPWCPAAAARTPGRAAAARGGRHAEGEGEEPAAEVRLQPQPQAALPQRAPPRRAPHRVGMEVEIDGQEKGKKTVRKPYVVNEMEYEASLPEKKSNTLSRDLIDYVRYMIQNHGENYKDMARDEKNYYQDTPKQIKRKINVYKNFYPEEYKAFVASLKQEKMDVQ